MGCDQSREPPAVASLEASRTTKKKRPTKARRTSAPDADATSRPPQNPLAAPLSDIEGDTDQPPLASGSGLSGTRAAELPINSLAHLHSANPVQSRHVQPRQDAHDLSFNSTTSFHQAGNTPPSSAQEAHDLSYNSAAHVDDSSIPLSTAAAVDLDYQHVGECVAMIRAAQEMSGTSDLVQADRRANSSSPLSVASSRLDGLKHSCDSMFNRTDFASRRGSFSSRGTN